uniref:Rhomboid-like protease n=1 Tax=Alexandrium catenella TaxID=2925 RepID=A0A7S1RWF7_ALECA|mmetsp:Transcript_76264/g.202525  ORF Transcript_76264/g.202525 Transcript_76264/m.202525 type:complete len:326 (+) Transcript_76264:68-1045(+)
MEGLAELWADFREQTSACADVLLLGLAVPCTSLGLGVLGTALPALTGEVPRVGTELAALPAPAGEAQADAQQDAVAAAGDGQGPRQLQSVFPGYSDAPFLLGVSALQCLAFGGTLLVGHVGLLPTTCSLYLLGASWGPSVAVGEVWRLALPLLLHGSLPHLAVNVLFQLRVGMGLEREMGSKRFALMYVLSGVFGNIVSAACDPWKLAVGCSTSGLGVLGGNFAAVIIRWGERPSQLYTWLIYLGLLTITSFDASSHTDVYAHAGGFVGGLCLTTLMHPKCELDDERRGACGRSSVQRLSLGTLVAAASLAGARIHGLAPIALPC